MSGSVRDAANGEPLAFAHILVEESGSGVVTNKEGQYRLSLHPGAWTLRVSYIGYRPRTRQLTVHANMEGVDFSLQPRTFNMPEVTVTPDDSLARLIVHRTRLRRIEREKDLTSWYNRAHSKVYARIDSTRNMDTTLAARLTAHFLDIGETQTEGWHKRPDKHKVLIHARQQTDLFEGIGNTMHSGFAEANFAGEEIRLGDKSGAFAGPISEEGLEDVYWYSVAGMAKGERRDIWRIRVLPKSEMTPGLSGYYYIEDSTWSVTQVELEFNPAARAVFLPMADSIVFRQQFSLYEDRFWLPSAGSVSVQAKMNLMGMIVWLGMEATAAIAEYRINPAGIDSVFDDYRIEVLPEADHVTSEDWERRRLQPPSLVDADIYRISDSMAVIEAQEKMAYGVGEVISGKELEQGSMLWDVPGLVSMLRFNRVEGFALAVPYASEDKEGTIRRYAAEIGYGFLDHRFKGSASGRFSLGGRDPSFLALEAYHDLSPLFHDDMLYGEMVATSAVVFGRYDKRDYYYRRGGGLGWSAHALPWLETDIGAAWTDYGSAEKHSDWSAFGEGVYRENPPVQDGSVLSARLSLSGDFRSRMLDVGRVKRGSRSPSQFLPSLGVEYRRMDLDAGSWETWIPHISLSGSIGFGLLGKADYRLSWSRATDRLPVQGLLTLPGSEFGVTTPLRFRTAFVGEFAGDERAMINVDHNFGKLPLLWMGLPEGKFYAAEMWELHLFASAGWTHMHPGTAALLTRDIHEARLPLIEAGIGIDRLFGVMRLEFGHRITHRGSDSDWFLGLAINP
ncbi:MAG: carboxypeptidase-like regulatory domain-containing protein [Bacteroidetes bacterium]|nr:carboxypeptidase-like regulatory domain-containing protein [Bacteroidota bacterium]